LAFWVSCQIVVNSYDNKEINTLIEHPL